ncbi:hypothetical protein MXB_3349 [Myxobolus squamalis]|nr:hypothetical protein MXB_3349 [Myxobolus squamalis]
MDEKKLKKIEKRRRELEQWKKSKYEAKQLMQKITKPPFRPVGKSSQTYLGKPYVDPYLQSQTSRIHRTSKVSTASASIAKFTSTPFAKNAPLGAPKPFKKPSFLKSDRRKTSFEITATASHIASPKKKTNRKSVQFKEKIIEIPPVPIADDFKSPTSEDTNQTTIDDVRRVSHAGRTPFSCASSRSGSTPGRRDYPSKSVNMTEGETITEMFASKNSQKGIKRTPTPRSRRSKRHSTLPLLKWSVRKDSIIARDPYPLRSRTPVSVINKSLKPIESSGIRSVISKSSFLSQKKKSLKVVKKLY